MYARKAGGAHHSLRTAAPKYQPVPAAFEFGNASSWDYIYPRWDTAPSAATATGLKWNSLVSDGTDATIGYDGMAAHHGYASLKIIYRKGTGTAGVTNRGIGNEYVPVNPTVSLLPHTALARFSLCACTEQGPLPACWEGV